MERENSVFQDILPQEKQEYKAMTPRNILLSPSADVLAWAQNFFIGYVPTSIDTSGDMHKVQKLLPDITNKLTYVNAVLAWIYLDLRNSRERAKDKKDVRAKERYEDAKCKKEIFEGIQDILKQQYACLSRMISTREDILKEINMANYTMSS